MSDKRYESFSIRFSRRVADALVAESNRRGKSVDVLVDIACETWLNEGGLTMSERLDETEMALAEALYQLSVFEVGPVTPGEETG